MNNNVISGDNKHGFRPDIEGLRAIAILLVVFYHAGHPWFGGGFVGVDVFFVLSGYLITSLLVQEAERTGTVDLVKFYSRRARRLLPALAVVLIVTIVLGGVLFAPFEQRDLANTAISTASYLSNIYFARAATDYLGAGAETNPLLHTWSLSVEEQFYFIWPLFVVFGLGISKRMKRAPSRIRLLVWMTAGAIISFSLSVYLTSTRQPWAFFLSPARAWEFAVGAICVLAPQHSSSNSESRWPGIFRESLGALGLFGIFFSAIVFDKYTTFPGVAALLPVFSTLCVLRASSNVGTWARKALSLRPLQEIGRLSYSWYLWHWPVLVFAATLNHSLTLNSKVFLLIVSLFLAELSYRFVENPIRHNQLLSRKSSYSLVMAAFITVVAVGTSFAWRLLSFEWAKLPGQEYLTRAKEDVPKYPAGCHADFYDVNIDIDSCTVGPENTTRTLVLFGDSHAAQWYPAVFNMAFDDGWRLILMTKSGCAPVDAPLFDTHIGREYIECATWRNSALEKIGQIQPDLVVLSGYSHYTFDSNQWLSGTENVLSKLSMISQKVAYLRDTPAFLFDAPTLLARMEWNSPFLDKSNKSFEIKNSDEIYALQMSIVNKYKNVFSVDMTPEICPQKECLIERDGVVLFHDAHHLSASFSKQLSKSLSNKLLSGISNNELLSEVSAVTSGN